MIPVYTPDKYTIGFGIPGTPAYVSIKDWISITPEKQAQRFTGSKGVISGEPFIEMSTDSSVRIKLVLLQSSVDIQDMHNLFIIQQTGVLGFPFSIIDNGSDNNANQGRQKSAYPVAVLEDETQKDLELIGKSWIYTIWSPSGGTLFF